MGYVSQGRVSPGGNVKIVASIASLTDPMNKDRWQAVCLDSRGAARMPSPKFAVWITAYSRCSAPATIRKPLQGSGREIGWDRSMVFVISHCASPSGEIREKLESFHHPRPTKYRAEHLRGQHARIASRQDDGVCRACPLRLWAVPLVRQGQERRRRSMKQVFRETIPRMPPFLDVMLVCSERRIRPKLFSDDGRQSERAQRTKWPRHS